MNKALVVGLLLLTGTAQAAVHVNDQVGILSAAAKADLEATPTQHRVVANFITASSKEDLDAMMGRCITSPNTICVGVDPTHHWAFTHFGIDTGVRKVDHREVSLAGNLDFYAGRWAEGVKSILSRANAVSVRSNAPAAVVVNQPIVEKPFPMWPFFLGGGLFVILVFVMISWIRKRERKAMEVLNDARGEVGEMASRNVERDTAEDFQRRLDASMKKDSVPAVSRTPTPTGLRKNGVRRRYADQARTYEPPAYSPPPPAAAPPVIVTQSSGSDLVTGLVIGQALGESHHHDHERYRERTPEPVRERTPAPMYERNYDAGGYGGRFTDSDSGGDGSSFGGSSDDSSSSSSSSDDSSSSSSDSGSSYDGGGSGGDF